MDYLARDAALRRDARELLADARTLVTVALSYAHDQSIDVPAERLVGGPLGRIARYARGADYHVVLKEKLHALRRAVVAALDGGEAVGPAGALRPPAQFVACVDTAPLLEREAAQASGLGFIGKNTLLIAPRGRQLFGPGCAHHRSRVCAGRAVGGAALRRLSRVPRRLPDRRLRWALHARRAPPLHLHLTIELSGAMPRELRPLVGNHVFGCDVCQEVCPWNASSAVGEEASSALAPRAGVGRPELRRLLQLGAAQFRKWQKRSALRRNTIGPSFCAMSRWHSVTWGKKQENLPALAEVAGSPYPLVRAHVAWAIGQIGARSGAAEARALLAARQETETEAEVRDELACALAALPP